MRNFQTKKLKGMSIQSMIVAGIIGAVMAAVAISLLWSSLERQKVSGIASSLVAQYEALDLQEASRFVELEEIEEKYSDGDIDYLDEMIKARLIKFDPSNYFNDPNAVWEIRRLVKGDSFPVYYIYIESSDPIDMERVREAYEIAGIDAVIEGNITE